MLKKEIDIILTCIYIHVSNLKNFYKNLNNKKLKHSKILLLIFNQFLISKANLPLNKYLKNNLRK